MAFASTTDNAKESYSSSVIQTTSWYDAGLNKFPLKCWENLWLRWADYQETTVKKP